MYEDVTALREELCCKREPGNCQDPFTEAVVRSGVTVGHIPKKISSVCCKRHHKLLISQNFAEHNFCG